MVTATLAVLTVHHCHVSGDASIRHFPVTAALVVLLLMFMFLKAMFLMLARLLPTIFVFAMRHRVCPRAVLITDKKDNSRAQHGPCRFTYQRFRRRLNGWALSENP
ncbi:MAG: hypothetical protein ACO1RT_10625 [Planctomycetaceae bacterium]